MNGKIYRRAAACVASILVFSSAPAAFAGDASGYVWTPSKTGSNAYKLRMGAKVPAGRWDVSAGPEVSVSANDSGRVAEGGASAGFWGLFTRSRGSGTARTTTQDVNVNFSATSGAGNVGISSNRRIILTPRFDLESRRAVTMQCNAYESHCGQARVTQTTRVRAVETNTTLVAQSSAEVGRVRSLDQIGLEQTFGKVTLGASVSDPSREARGVFSARYSLNW